MAPPLLQVHGPHLSGASHLRVSNYMGTSAAFGMGQRVRAAGGPCGAGAVRLMFIVVPQDRHGPLRELDP